MSYLYFTWQVQFGSYIYSWNLLIRVDVLEFIDFSFIHLKLSSVPLVCLQNVCVNISAHETEQFLVETEEKITVCDPVKDDYYVRIGDT